MDGDWIQVLAEGHGVGAPSARVSRPRRRSVSHDAGPDLRQTIESQIIPRLLLAHASQREVVAACPDGRPPPTTAEISEFADLVVAQDMPSVLGVVEAMSRGGLPLETILLDLVGAAARLLGEQWLEDARSFSEVTLGLGTLQRVVAVLGHKVDPPVSHRGLVVLLAPPGEQHTLAIHLLGELLRNAGWGAHVDPRLTEDELVDLVASEPVVMVGLSVSNTALIDALGRLVREVKRASLNPEVLVMLGGPMDLTEYAARVGAVFCPSARDCLDWLGRHDRGEAAYRTD